VYLVAERNLNTLIDFRHQRYYEAERGENGAGRNLTGKRGDDIEVSVPVGTVAYDEETGEMIGDLIEPGQRLLVAKGGWHGLGNLRYKSSINRAPRQSKPGTVGELRVLRMELKLLADVGLLGLPNAGKSTLISAVSSARPKVADYPFTTLYPNLGVVSVGVTQSFVMADIPGLIEGAAEGAGLGIQFLRHLARTSLLLHVVDVAPMAEENEPVRAVRTIEGELEQYSEELSNYPRWLVLNKIDILPPEERVPRCQEIVALHSVGQAEFSRFLPPRGLARKICVSTSCSIWTNMQISRTEFMPKTQRWVVKIGSALLTRDGEGLDREALADWAGQMARLHQSGVEIVLVSSGAVPKA